MLRYVLFDLDDTLYPASTGLWQAVNERINRYLVERLGFAPESVDAIRKHYFQTYGTTLNGLRQTGRILDPVEYYDYVHDLPLERYLRPAPALAAMLRRLPLECVVFTNADAPHARRVLHRLGIAERFRRIIDIYALDYANKPQPTAYTRALTLLDARPAECALVDDALRNLHPARDLGMLTVLIGPSRPPCPPEGDHHCIEDLLELETILTSGAAGQRLSAAC